MLVGNDPISEFLYRAQQLTERGFKDVVTGIGAAEPFLGILVDPSTKRFGGEVRVTHLANAIASCARHFSMPRFVVGLVDDDDACVARELDHGINNRLRRCLSVRPWCARCGPDHPIGQRSMKVMTADSVEGLNILLTFPRHQVGGRPSGYNFKEPSRRAALWLRRLGERQYAAEQRTGDQTISKAVHRRPPRGSVPFIWASSDVVVRSPRPIAVACRTRRTARRQSLVGDCHAYFRS